jgi:hypothetical protein
MNINFYTLVLSFCINLLKRLSSKISQRIQAKIYPFENENLKDLQEKSTAARKERDSYNPVDQFAAYSLANRKLNKFLDKNQEEINKIRSKRMQFMMYFNIIYNLLVILCSIILIWTNYDKPVIDFSGFMNNIYKQTNDTYNNELDEQPKARLFYPLDWLISFPNTKKTNTVGLTLWILITNRLFDIFLNKIGFNVHKLKFEKE